MFSLRLRPPVARCVDSQGEFLGIQLASRFLDYSRLGRRSIVDYRAKPRDPFIDDACGAKACFRHQRDDSLAIVSCEASVRMDPAMEPERFCSFAACEVDHLEATIGLEHSLNLAEGRKLGVALEVVEHERREYPIEARRFASEAVGETALETNPDLGATRLALRTL